MSTGLQHRSPWHHFGVRLRRSVGETPGVKSYDLEFDDPLVGSQFRFLPGQFNMLYVPGVGEAAISISDRSDKGLLRHTIRRVGAVTEALDKAPLGASLALRGPFGAPWPVHLWSDDTIHETKKSNSYREPPPSQPTEKIDVILVAGGIGVAPLRTAIQSLIRHRDRVGKVDLLIGARQPDDLLYTADYDVWSQQGIAIRTTVDRGSDHWQGNVGVVTLLLDRLTLPSPQSTVLMTCGPEVMMRYVAQTALHRGIPQSQIWVALERNMNCAIGFCGHCQLGPEFVCKDGPVFSYDRIGPWLGVRGL